MNISFFPRKSIITSMFGFTTSICWLLFALQLELSTFVSTNISADIIPIYQLKTSITNRQLISKIECTRLDIRIGGSHRIVVRTMHCRSPYCGLKLCPYYHLQDIFHREVLFRPYILMVFVFRCLATSYHLISKIRKQKSNLYFSCP